MPTPPGDAHRLVDLERGAGAPSPDGCDWLDQATIEDLELSDVAISLDRTVSPAGAQQLWRMIAAPAQRLEVLAMRESALAELAHDPDGASRLRKVLARMAEPDTAYVPLLLWSEMPPLPMTGRTFGLLQLALILCVAGGFLVTPFLWIAAMLLFLTNVFIDDRTNTRLANHARALQMFGKVLDVGTRIVDEKVGPARWRDAIAAELPPLEPLRRRLRAMTVKDPLDISGVVIAALLVRPKALSACLELLQNLRGPMTRLHRLVGELDALQSIASWRAERADELEVPVLTVGPPALDVFDLRHPTIPEAVGNDLALLGRSLVITGSNMSGKSTFLRTLALNAVLAQSIHTVCGSWRSSLLRVHTAMRAVDATAEGLSTYAAEVAAVRKLITAAEGPAALFALDEPFRGTNPSVRVPIVVAVLEHLARGHIVTAATHDLDVAHQLSADFDRGYFKEVDDDDEGFDYQLRPGTAVTTNAVTLLRKAGYPESILAAVAAASSSIAHAHRAQAPQLLDDSASDG